MHTKRNLRDQSVTVIELETISHLVNRAIAFNFRHAYQKMHFVFRFLSKVLNGRDRGSF